MGQTSADTQREIESIRDELSATVAELERRTRRLVDLRMQAQEHPTALSVIGIGLLAGASVVAYNAVSSVRESRKPVNRARQRARGVTEDLSERWERTRDRLPLRVTMRNKEGEEVSVSRSSYEEPGMIKKILWAGLTAAVVALFGLLARRASSAIWETILREPPPTAKV